MKYIKSTFLKNVITLVTGTTIAQVIPLALSPILTRIYSPNDFGLLSTYISIAAIFSVLVTFKYDLAIIITEKKEDAASLLVGSVFIALIISAIIFVIILLFNIEIARLLLTEGTEEDIENLSAWLYFIPISVLFMGLFNSISFWFNRNLLYKRMAYSKVANTTGMTAAQVGFGYAKFIPVGLVIGFVMGRVFSVVYLIYKLRKDKDSVFLNVKRETILKLLRKYKKFPFFTLPSEFVNILSNRLPVFVIGKYFGAGVLGNYALMERVLSAPISLIGSSVLDVFKQKASADYAELGNCKQIFVKTFKTLVLLSIIPSILLFFLSPIVFKFIFGDEWAMAGDFAQILAFLFFIRFTASPLSYMFNIAQKQQYDMYWQITLFICTIISFYIGVQNNDVKMALTIFTISYSILYVINIYLSYTFAKGNIPKKTKR